MSADDVVRAPRAEASKTREVASTLAARRAMAIHQEAGYGTATRRAQTALALEDKFEILKDDLGDGSFGTVALARVRTAGAHVARRGTLVRALCVVSCACPRRGRASSPLSCSAFDRAESALLTSCACLN